MHFQLLFYELAKFDGMRLKIEGALILCVVAVLAKTCLEKFTPKVRRKSYNFTRSSFNVYLFSAKITISKFLNCSNVNGNLKDNFSFILLA